MDQQDPFARATKMARTPVKTDPPDRKTPGPEEEAPPPGEVRETIETEEESEGEFETQKTLRSRSSKRKNVSITPEKENAPKQTRLDSNPRGLENKIIETVEIAAELEDMANRYGNTKVEIKRMSEKLKKELEEVLDVWVDQNRAQKQHRELLLAELSAHKKENTELKKKIETLEQLGRKIENTEKIESMLDKIENVEDVEELVKAQWPDRAHKLVKSTTKSILSQAKTKIIIVNENNQKDVEIINRISAIYPIFGKAIKRAEIGKVTKLKIKEDIIEEQENEEAPETQQILVIKIAKSTEKEIIVSAKNACNNLVEEPGTILAYMTHDIDVSSTLKILECCVFKQKWKIELCAKGRGLKKRKMENRENLKTMIVKNAEGKTYADTLKTIKTVIKPEEKGVTVRKIARTRDGNVVIKLRDEAPGASAEISKVINQETKSKAEIKKEPKMQILVHDLDGITEEGEIEEAIRELTGETGELQISDPNPSKNGSWTAKVLAPRKTGEKLMEARTIKIGWTRCRITEKITIPICYNCLKLGHLGSVCTEERVNFKRCYKCTSREHEAGNCDGEPKCSECNKTGHTVNSFDCPRYRQLIQERFAKSKARANAHK